MGFADLVVDRLSHDLPLALQFGDRAKVATAVPDELSGLVDQLPSLRTGEGVFLGEVMPIPSRVRVRRAKQKPVGDDPKLPGRSVAVLEVLSDALDPIEFGA